VPPTGAVVVAAATVVEVTGTVVVLVVLGDPGPELTNTLGAPERPGSAGPAASPSPHKRWPPGPRGWAAPSCGAVLRVPGGRHGRSWRRRAPMPPPRTDGCLRPRPWPLWPGPRRAQTGEARNEVVGDVTTLRRGDQGRTGLPGDGVGLETCGHTRADPYDPFEHRGHFSRHQGAHHPVRRGRGKEVFVTSASMYPSTNLGGM